jgi:hypothetical protein
LPVGRDRAEPEREVNDAVTVVEMKPVKFWQVERSFETPLPGSRPATFWPMRSKFECHPAAEVNAAPTGMEY